MPILNDNVIPAAGVAGYEIANSLRVNDNDSAYFVRTPASAGNQKTWTLSFWMKKGSKFSAYQNLFDVNNGRAGIPRGGVQLNNTDQISVWMNSSGSGSETVVKPNRKIRDPNAWYHILVVADSTDATASERMRLYINGERQTDLQTGNYASQNTNYPINRVDPHYFCRDYTGSYYYDGYMAEIHFVDGQALTTADFGEAGDYGEWKAVEYTGTYGTNGWYLDFENSGSLGSDVSGNGNNFTLGNLVATDQMLDSPTNNFCTLDPLQKVDSDSSIVFSEGNLKADNTNASLWAGTYTNWGLSSGKWYWETVIVEGDSTADFRIGIQQFDGSTPVDWDAVSPQNYSGSIFYYGDNGNKRVNGSSSVYGSSYGINDILGVALDMDAETVTFYKNGVSQGVLNLSLTGNDGKTVTPAYAHYIPAFVANFGQDSSFAGNKTAQGNADDNGYGDFYYAPPTGYLALCTANLPDPTVTPSEHFGATLWTGDGNSNRTITTGHQSDFVWIKRRDTAASHLLHDVIRGAGQTLHSHLANAEASNGTYYVQSFNSDGFQLGSPADGSDNILNGTYAGWTWKANGAGVSNTDGSITSTVSANTLAGFSIINWVGTGALATVGHGLSKAPELVFYKNRSTASNWIVYEKTMGATCRGLLDLTNAWGCSGNNGYWNSTDPSATVLTVNTDAYTNGNGNNMLAYAFHSVEGYCKISTYEGNGSTDGTFVFCGLKAKYIMIKELDSTSNWSIIDVERGFARLHADESVAEYAAVDLDVLSNGFKIRNTNSNFNTSGSTYMYMAIAENPFKHANAA